MYWLIQLVLAALIQRWKSYWPWNSSSVYAFCSESNRIYTVDVNDASAKCIVVKDDRIALVTGNRDIVTQRYPDVKINDLPQEYALYPGFTDAHGHILEFGSKQQLDVQGSESVSEVTSKIHSFINKRPEVLHNTSYFIVGMGWDQNLWDGNFPTAEMLEADDLLKNRPISLKRVDGHAAWVSPTVLGMMNPLPDEVEGGQIIRDSVGHPTGIFLDNAMDLIPYPPWTDAQYMEYFNTAMEDAISVGLTSIHDAFTTPDQVDFFKTMAEQGNVPIRLYLMGAVSSDEYWGDQFEKLHDFGKDGRITLRSIKIMADGALGSWGAAMTQPYSDNPSTKGFLLQSESVLSSLIERFFEDGWQTNVHCIGDYANHVLLDIYEKMLSKYDAAETRPRIEHAQILQVEDIQRLGRLGVIVSVQPTHATSDMWYAEQRLGPSRIAGAYAYKTMIKATSPQRTAFGSDFPIEGINPLLGFYAAVTRLSPDGTSPHGSGGWIPEEKVTRKDALYAMTMGPAYAAFAENVVGSLEVGKKADFVVLDGDIMTVPVNEILNCKVKLVAVDGNLREV